MDFKTGNTLEAKRRMASDVGFNDPVPTIAFVIVFVLVVLSLDAPFGDLLHTT